MADPQLLGMIANPQGMISMPQLEQQKIQTESMKDQEQLRKMQLQDVIEQKQQQQDVKKSYVFNPDGSVNQEETIKNLQHVNPELAIQAQSQMRQQQIQKQQAFDGLMQDMSQQANNIMTRYDQIKATQGEQAAEATVGPIARQMAGNFKQRAVAMGHPLEEDPSKLDDKQVIQKMQEFQLGYKDYAKQMTERHKAQSESEYKQQMLGIAKERTGIAKQALEQRTSPQAMLDDETVDSMADQYLAGDTSVFQNLGRGAQGSQNIAKLRKAIANKEKQQGVSGGEQAQRIAEFAGAKAGQRTLGTRMANVQMAVREADKFSTLALKASEELPRGEFVPFNKAQQMAQSATGDPKYSRFVAANTSLINAYARAVSPSGVPTVNDKEHAREMLSTAMTKKQYSAVVDQLKQEMKAAMEAPEEVKSSYREMAKGTPSQPAGGDFSHLWK